MMKKILYLLALVLFLNACENKNSTDRVEDQKTVVSEKKEFVKLDVDKDWDENPFTWFKGQGLLLAVGDSTNNNAMTIGWGSLGNIWGKIGENTVTVYVAEARYTYEFMEKYDYFTVMAFDK